VIQISVLYGIRYTGAMLRKMLYHSGDVFLPDRVRDFLGQLIVGRYEDTFYISYWSLVHMLTGVITGLIILYYRISRPYLLALTIHTVWELWQVFIGMNKPFTIRGRNNIIDTLVDTILFMMGFATVKLFENIF